MLKAIRSTQDNIKVTTALGESVTVAKKECQFLATILRTNVELSHNGDTFLIDAKGNCIQQNNQLASLINQTVNG